jgi:hypothetical protein
MLFASIERRFPATRTYRVLPFFLAGAFVLIASLNDASPAAGVGAFGASPLLDAGVTLPAIFAMAAVAAVSMGLLSIVISHPIVQRSPVESGAPA